MAVELERDESAVLVNYLLNHGELISLVGSRIWGEAAFPIPSWSPEDGACICLKVRGGSGEDETGRVKVPSIQFKCYGTTKAKAREVARTLDAALNPVKGKGLLYANRETQPQTIEEESGWIYALVFYRVGMSKFTEV
jgi:hypothetical protein